MRGDPEGLPLPSISDLLREGQEIIVQIAKEPLGPEGRAHHLAHRAARPLPGLHADRRPHRRFAQDSERRRAPAPEARFCRRNRTGIPGGYIVRTAGEGRTEEELRADMMFLYNLWLDMRQKAEKRPAPAADPPRSERGGAHPARSAHVVVQEHLGGQRGGLRERAALRAALPAGAGQPREDVHARRRRSSTSSASRPNWRRRCGPRSG